jgi:hypothetical protein
MIDKNIYASIILKEKSDVNSSKFCMPFNIVELNYIVVYEQISFVFDNQLANIYIFNDFVNVVKDSIRAISLIYILIH